MDKDTLMIKSIKMYMRLPKEYKKRVEMYMQGVLDKTSETEQQENELECMEGEKVDMIERR